MQQTPDDWYARNVVQQICEETVNRVSREASFKSRTTRVTASQVKQILSLKPTTNLENSVRRRLTSL